VGYLELTEDYQLEFTEDHSYNELEEKMEYLSSLPFVSYVSLNYVDFAEPQW